jgi:hypothetical protein
VQKIGIVEILGKVMDEFPDHGEATRKIFNVSDACREKLLGESEVCLDAIPLAAGKKIRNNVSEICSEGMTLRQADDEARKDIIGW